MTRDVSSDFILISQQVLDDFKPGLRGFEKVLVLFE